MDKRKRIKATSTLTTQEWEIWFDWNFEQCYQHMNKNGPHFLIIENYLTETDMHDNDWTLQGDVEDDVHTDNNNMM